MEFPRWAVCILVILCGTSRCQASLVLQDTVVELYEFEDNTVILTTASCNVSTESVKCCVTNPSSSPCGSPSFNVYPSSIGANSYQVTYLPGQSTMNYDQKPQYLIDLTCDDDCQQKPQGTVEVRLRPNTPPFFITDTQPKNINNAETAKAGQSLFAVSCNDDNLDSLTYSMTTNPTSNLFSIGVTDGIIRAAGDLVAECRTQIAFQVTCQDPYHPAVGPITIQATLLNPNDRPTITGLNTVLDLPEDAAIGATLRSFTVTDSDATTCTLSTIPLDSLQYFQISATAGAIQVKSKLNYEQLNTINTNITVTCTDNYCTSEKAYLYVRITDVNEPIDLYPKNFVLSTYEGQISLDPGWTPIDEDQNDIPTYTIVGGNTNGRFAINPTTGVITSTLQYDVDQGAMPTTDYIVVQAKDQGGHTSTTTVSLTILDKNDNRPVFNPQTQQFTITDCASTVGVPFGTVTATDQDSSFEGNNVLTYSGSNGPITIGSTGSIIPSSGITGGNTYVVSAQVTDAGQTPGKLTASSPASVTVIVQPCPTTTTAAPTTTPSPTTKATTAAVTTAAPVTVAGNTANSLDENLGWIVIAGLLATVFVAALGLMLWRFCWPAVCGAGKHTMFFDRYCGNCCQPRPSPRTVQPVRGQPPRHGNKGFWQERYPDDDYRDQPNRDRTPSPAPMEGAAPLALEPWRPRALRY